MSETYQRLAHSSWDCKYHVVFVPNDLVTLYFTSLTCWEYWDFKIISPVRGRCVRNGVLAIFPKFLISGPLLPPAARILSTRACLRRGTEASDDDGS